MTTRLGVQSTVIYDPQRIYERYGLGPGQMIDFKALKGDSTDNIPGIPGVGDKTAARLLVDHGSLEGIYEDIGSIKPDKLREKLREHRDDVTLWRELVTIDRLAPIELDLDGLAPRALRPTRGHPPVPRVRVPHARRAAA